MTDDQTALALIREHAIDCLIWFSRRPVPEALLRAPTLGVWRYCFGGGTDSDGRWSCLEEISQDAHVINIRLVRLVAGAGEVLRKAVVGTVRRSYRATLTAATSAAAHLLAQACVEHQRTASSGASREQVIIEHHQRKAHMARQAVSAAMKMLRYRVEWMLRWATISEQWTLGVVDRPIADCLDDDFLKTVRFVATDKAHYLADGFGWVRDGRRFVLCEQYDYKANRGLIVWLELDAQANIVTGPKPALDIDVHASYPYLFNHDGKMYCCPEAWESGSLALWEAIDPPAVWRQWGEILPDVPAIDPVVFHHDGLWWLLCGREDDQPHEKLYGYYAETPSGPWRPHELNPLTIDVRCARSAGTPFRHDGHLYRPGQDCSRTYGGRLCITRVTQLSPDHFAEEVVRTIDAPSGTDFPDGIHTISPFGDGTLIDAKRWQLSPRGFWLKARKLLAQLRWTNRSEDRKSP
ncbi:MAG: hypothetical protein HKN84_06310 [Gammaproteobacteria bacterium]|nr:hypothetical protein [Gammaproteobacteria bacterium]